jgi:hypothetical protein
MTVTFGDQVIRRAGPGLVEPPDCGSVGPISPTLAEATGIAKVYKGALRLPIS